MSKWKLCRQTYGDDVYEFKEGDEVTIGRGTQNTIILPSLNISRKHCVITVKKDEVIIEDLKSANGIFVGLKKIPPNIPFSLSNNDIIGLGWTDGAPLAKVNDAEKFVFKLVKTTGDHSIIDRIQFQTENEPLTVNVPQPVILKQSLNLSLKRKSNTEVRNHDESALSSSNIQMNYVQNKNELPIKKFKHSIQFEDAKDDPIIKTENEDEHKYEAFNIKQECVDDEVQVIDSDSDSEQWYIRLSQNSPRKSFSNFNETRKSEECQQDSSYSQLDDDVIFVENEIRYKDEPEEDDYQDDLFTILPQLTNIFDGTSNTAIATNSNANNMKNDSKTIPDFTNACKDTTEKNNKSVLPKSNLPLEVLDGTSYNEKTSTDNVINKRNDIIVVPELTKGSDDTNENKKLKLSLKFNNLFDDAPRREIIEMANKVNNTTNSYKENKKDKETKHTVLSETEMKGSSRKIQLTDYKSQPSKKSSHNSKGKLKKKFDHNKSKSSSSKIKITNSQKEERKKKLREIAVKDKGEDHLCNSSLLRIEDFGTTSTKVSAKITPSNRGAFLIDSKQLSSKPSNKKKGPQDKKDTNSRQDNKNSMKSPENNDAKAQPSGVPDTDKEHRFKTQSKSSELKTVHSKHRTLSADLTVPPSTDVSNTAVHRRYSDNITKNSELNKDSATNREKKEIMPKNQNENLNSKKSELVQREETLLEKCRTNITNNCMGNNTSHLSPNESSVDKKLGHQMKMPSQQTQPVLKSSMKTILKTVKQNKEPNSKSDKKVRFSESKPEIREFEIEQGNQMKKTSNVKSMLLATHHSTPLFSLQKIALMRILRWNPQWLEEQNNTSEPPPILGHNNVPMAILHSFSSHTQYVELIGDLLLMEIWECLTQGYIKTRTENTFLQMRIESLPLVPPQRRVLELINLNVNVSVPTAQARTIPREGEIMIFHFGEEGKICRFFFVHNVRCLPSPPNNINSFFSISLQTTFTDKITTLQRGAIMYGRSLAYINKDLRLFEAMEYLSRSPLGEVILNPQPSHFLLDEGDRSCTMESQWTQPLNDSQRKAVMCAVSAAHGERPRIHMIQGPPGTGKSRVICAIVMEYFYDAAGKRQKNRGKILLCATSNAAVDELVVRLLDIRQSLPQPERLRLVRVGREEAMHARARDISSQRLAQRDAARLQPEPLPPPAALSAEISLLEAKKNMWQTKAMSTDDDARKAYCQNRVVEITKKIAMFRGGGAGGGGAACGREQLAQAERRVLECADVVLTTLASAHSHKMRGLAGRIALCVVDEAGQAIEPETLVPLTLDVTHLALVGDPQQLPGFICSQRAKQHGLGESLFSRLSSCAESWGAGGSVLLDRQYRMHPQIADYPNRVFYEGRVHNETALAPAPALLTAPYFVLGIISGDNGQDASGANEAEAWGAARVALALRWRLREAAPHGPHAPAAPPSPPSLAVITPYAAQRDLVRRHLRTLLQAESVAGGPGCAGCGEEGEVEVNTVDSFQGQERSVVVVSLARSHGLGFLTAAGRMNVMLTRAKHALVLCLNPRALEKNPQWRSLVEDAQKRNLYGTLPLDMCRHPSVQQVSNQDILQYLSSNPPAIARNPPHQPRRRPHRNHRRRYNEGRN